MGGPSAYRLRGHGVSLRQPRHSARTSDSLAPAKACTGLTSTRTSASRACCTELRHAARKRHPRRAVQARGVTTHRTSACCRHASEPRAADAHGVAGLPRPAHSRPAARRERRPRQPAERSRAPTATRARDRTSPVSTRFPTNVSDSSIPVTTTGSSTSPPTGHSSSARRPSGGRQLRCST